ncbi:uncharacterized protein E2C01_038284 [Portunus trituberculatus]|uniref:Uncharacterized protein n=1 Tax=Portunus trituberculatus TaxID=210409 RepID=A0A5B7FGV1_PORTR|nr:uncharacterized protein [Portunus trituberculatus]
MMTDGLVLGTPSHEVVGEEYLKGLGFPEEITNFVRNHVEAKRYLVATDPKYYEAEVPLAFCLCQFEGLEEVLC